MPARPDHAVRLSAGLLDPTVIVLAQDPQDVTHRMDRPLLLTLLRDVEPGREVRKHDQALRDRTEFQRRRRQPDQQRCHVCVDLSQTIPDVVPNAHSHRQSLPVGAPRDQQRRTDRSERSATYRRFEALGTGRGDSAVDVHVVPTVLVSQRAALDSLLGEACLLGDPT